MEEATGRPLRLLFIGNSHTYVNDLPALVQKRAVEDGYDCTVTMLAHGGWTLEQHVKEAQTRFNIRYGGYDYVILQEHAHPLPPEETYRRALEKLSGWIRAAGAVPVLYAAWTTKAEPAAQAAMDDLNRTLATDMDLLLAPVGKGWWTQAQAYPDVSMYGLDGQHASPTGSDFAAGVIWQTIREKERT